MKDINRIKVVLVEKKRTSKWLAGELGKDPATISKWCTNSSQPDLQTLTKVAQLVGINMAAVNKQIKQLVTKGYVQRSEKDGSWRLIITPSI